MRFHLALLAFLAFAVASPCPGQAQTPVDQLTINTAIQNALIWTGHFDGLTDGAFGARSILAMSAFQGSQGWPATGDLDAGQRLHLLRIAATARRQVGFEVVRDAKTQISIGMPQRLVAFANSTPHGSRYASSRGDIELIVGRFGWEHGTFRDRYNQVLEGCPIKAFEQKVYRRDAFFVSGAKIWI